MATLSHGTPQYLTWDEVKDQVSLAEVIDYLKLGRKGRSFHCPNGRAHKHGDRNRSATIAASWETWHCFGCGAFGSVIDIYRYLTDVSKEDAKTWIEEYAGLTPAYGAITTPPPLPPSVQLARRTAAPDEPLPSASPDVHAFLARAQQALTNPQARNYLSRRGISFEIARQTGLGFALRGTWLNPRGAGQPRIVAPLTAPDGTLINLYGRAAVPCDKSLRHDFLPGPKGIFHAPALARNGVILVEGVFDALACLCGDRPSSAIMGLSIRDSWWKQIPATCIFLAVDADEAGQRRGKELQDLGASLGKKTIHMPKADANFLGGIKDLNEFWVTQGRLPRGLEAYDRLLADLLVREASPSPGTPPGTPPSRHTLAVPCPTLP
jgi:DNA primase